MIISASIFPHFCSPWKSPYMVFQLQEKNPQAIFFSLKIFVRGKKTDLYNDFPQTKGRLNSPAQEEQENCRRKWQTNSSAQGEQEKKRKENGVGTRLVPKEYKKGLNEPQTTIFSLIRSVVNESAAGRLEFRASARLSKIQRSSLSPCPQSVPISSLLAET